MPCKQKNPKQSDPEVANSDQTAPMNQAQYTALDQNVQLYARHSRILSLLDTEHQWNSYAWTYVHIMLNHLKNIISIYMLNLHRNS